MAWTLLSSAKAAAAGGGTTQAMDTSGASLIVIYVAGGSDATPTDSASNTGWTGLTLKTQDAVNGRLYYKVSPTTSATHTFTTTATFPTIIAAAFSGGATSPFDTSSGAVTNNLTTLSCGSITPAADGALLVTGVANDGGGAITVPSGFTQAQNTAFGSGVNYGGALAYLIQSTAAAVNPQWSWASGGSNDGAGTVASFLAAVAASTTPGSSFIPASAIPTSHFRKQIPTDSLRSGS